MLPINSTGKIGEDIACAFLVKQGFTLIERNHLQKWGELDIVSLKGSILHFFEVKTVSRDLTVTHVTHDQYRAEDNIHSGKVRRLQRVIQTYLFGKGRKYKENWQFNIITVILDKEHNLSKVDLWEDVIL
ncbi:MAG: YraN family protein [Candidatus Taylorbacteria bacterium]|nr:YraN family protein [Candidatus Taylorbacteria bacterium]